MKYGACALHDVYLRLQIHTLNVCNIHWFSTATMVARNRLNVTLHVHYLSCSYTVDIFHLSHRPQEELANFWISLARGIHLLPQFIFYFFCPTGAPMLWRICAYIHACDCVKTAYELSLLPNNTACETFSLKSGAARSVDWIFIRKAPAWRWLGKYVILDKTFCKLLFSHDVREDPVTYTFSSLSHSSRKPLLENKYNM